MRNKFEQEVYYLDGPESETKILNRLLELPMDSEKPLQIVFREAVNIRSLDQNKLYHATVKGITEQVVVDGRRYDKPTWEYYMKQAFLPEFADEKLTKSDYKKWTYLPTGDRVLCGSTTELTTVGMSNFLDEVIKFSLENGVVQHEEV